MIVTRFAPSPTGWLHLGHAYSALFAQRWAESAGGEMLLRIEDIDPGRCRPRYVDAIGEDLRWLGVRWREPVRVQSEHLAEYTRALDRLAADGLLYPCFCSRKEILAEIGASASAAHGPAGPLYPGTCRRLSPARAAARRAAGEPHALRLDLERGLERVGELVWHARDLAGERTARVADPRRLGDVVLAGKEVRTSYHLAVTVDDAAQGVTLVTRGEDLEPATDVHRLLQALLGLPTPDYCHHQLLRDAEGRRLAKRDRSLTLRARREAGASVAEVLARIEELVDEPTRRWLFRPADRELEVSSRPGVG